VTEIASAPITSKKGGHFIKRTLRIVLLSLLGLILSVVAMLYWQAGQKPQGAPKLVALGSSFAAGIGLGDRAAGSPFVCQRSRNGYPQLLARLHHIPIVDMTCSGATAQYVRGGGQVFLGPQLDGLAKDTEWVTLTAGGNDISYVGDLSFLAARKDQTIMGWALRQFWNGPRKPEERGYAKREDHCRNLSDYFAANGQLCKTWAKRGGSRPDARSRRQASEYYISGCAGRFCDCGRHAPAGYGA
jgi:lysophospholipase L1-like esterase